MRGLGWLIGALAWVIVSIVLFGFALYWRSEDREFRATARPSIATLVEHRQSDDEDRRGRDLSRTFEVYEFRTESGQVVRFTAAIEGMRRLHPIGTNLDILYPPADPSRARIADESAEEVATALTWCTPLGFVFSIPFFLLWRRSTRAEGHSQSV